MLAMNKEISKQANNQAIKRANKQNNNNNKTIRGGRGGAISNRVFAKPLV